MTHPAQCTDRPRRRGLLPADAYLGWTPYAWLLYLPIFLIGPFVQVRTGAMTAGYATATALGVVVFLVSYFRGFWAGGRELVLIMAVQTLLGVAFAPVNTGAAVFFVYAASFAANLERPRAAASAIVLVTIAGLLTSWLTGAPPYFWIPAIGLPLLIGFVNLHQAQVNRANAKLRLAQEQIEQLAAVAERERIARDLHDVLGHTLSLIVLKSELAAKLTTRDPARAAREIRDVEHVSRKALQEVREAIRGYRPSLADELERSRALLSAAGIRAEVAVPPIELERLVEETLAVALREAVTNVARHSGAGVCRIRLRREVGACLLEVEDDGRMAGAPEGNGLRGMRERVEALGGGVSRGRTAAGHGLHLEVRVPLATPKAAAAVQPMPEAANA